MPVPRVRIQTQAFDVNAEIVLLQAADPRIGAICTFIGTVRDRNIARGDTANNGHEPITAMELEHYPGMTESSIEAMIEDALNRFDILGARVVHRIGLLLPTDPVVLVAVSSAHRSESFKACEFLMDYLKTQAPFWKKEQTPTQSHWVDARITDDMALERWGIVQKNASN